MPKHSKPKSSKIQDSKKTGIGKKKFTNEAGTQNSGDNDFTKPNSSIRKQDCHLPKGNCVKEHMEKVHNAKRGREQEDTAEETQFSFTYPKQCDNILYKFRKIKHSSNLGIEVMNKIRASDVRGSLSRCFKKTIYKILNAQNNFDKEKSFKYVIKNEDQEKLFKELQEIVVSDKDFFGSFDPFDYSEHKEMKMKNPKYNRYITKAEVKKYIKNPTLRKAYRKLVENLLSDVTCNNIEKRLGFSPCDPEDFDRQELSTFFMNMCMNVKENEIGKPINSFKNSSDNLENNQNDKTLEANYF